MLHITLTRRDMHERNARAEEQILHKLIGFTRLAFGNWFDQLNPDHWLERSGITKQKVNMLAKDLVEKMDILVWTHNVENIIHPHLRANHIAPPHHLLQRAEQSQLSRGHKLFAQAIRQPVIGLFRLDGFRVRKFHVHAHYTASLSDTLPFPL